MQRAVGIVWASPIRYRGSTVLLCCCTLFLGGLCGLMAANQVSGVGSSMLSEYTASLVEMTKGGQILRPDFLHLIWSNLRWPLFAFIACFTLAAMAILPVLLFSRGFLLSFAIGSMIRIMPNGGFRAALILFVLTALATLPALLLLCCSGMEHAAIRLQEKKRTRFYLSPRLAFGVAIGMLAGIFSEGYLVPVFFSALCHSIAG